MLFFNNSIYMLKDWYLYINNVFLNNIKYQFIFQFYN